MFHLTLILTLTQANDQVHLLAVLEHECGEGVPKAVEAYVHKGVSSCVPQRNGKTPS